MYNLDTISISFKLLLDTVFLKQSCCLSVSGPFPLLYSQIQSRAYYHKVPRNSISDCSCPVPGVDGGKWYAKNRQKVCFT